MKTSLFLLLLPLILTSLKVSSQPNYQPTYTDAVYLVSLETAYHSNQAWEENDISEEIGRVLKRYGVNLTDTGTSHYSSSLTPLIKLAGTRVGYTTSGENITRGTSNFPSHKNQASAAGIGWEAAVLNGVSNFMAERFKDEVFHYALHHLFKQISGKDSTIFKGFFPESFKVINRLKAGKSFYSADIVYLKQVISYDLEQLQFRIANEAKSIFPSLPDQAKDVLLIGSSLHKNLSVGISLPETMRQLATLELTDSSFTDAMAINSILSEAFRDTVGSSRIWVDVSIFQGNSGHDGRVKSVFFGLLREQLRSYVHTTDETEDIRKLKALIPYISQLNAIAQQIKIHGITMNTPERLRLFEMVNTAVATFLFTAEKEGIIKVSTEYLKTFSSYQIIQTHLANRNYQQAFVIMSKELGQYFPKLTDDRYMRYLIFALQLAEIETAEEMQDLLSAYALPIGGSSIKRQSNWNISLNSYVGLTGGWETAYATNKDTKNNIGLAAPIGISVTYKGRITAFVSVIDIGSIVNVRLNNDTTSFSGLRFEQFLTPGLGLYYNIKKSPLTFGMHYNYIPNLRTIKIDNGSVSVAEHNVSVSRFNFSILVDIPFFTIYNR